MRIASRDNDLIVVRGARNIAVQIHLQYGFYIFGKTCKINFVDEEENFMGWTVLFWIGMLSAWCVTIGHYLPLWLSSILFSIILFVVAPTFPIIVIIGFAFLYLFGAIVVFLNYSVIALILYLLFIVPFYVIVSGQFSGGTRVYFWGRKQKNRPDSNKQDNDQLNFKESQITSFDKISPKKENPRDEIITLIKSIKGDFDKRYYGILCDDIFDKAIRNVEISKNEEIKESLKTGYYKDAYEIALYQIRYQTYNILSSGDGIVRYGAYMPQAEARIELYKYIIKLFLEKGYYSQQQADEEYEALNEFLKDR